MIKELNLKEIRKALNEGNKFKLIYGESIVPSKCNCVLYDMGRLNHRTLEDLMLEEPFIYGDINSVITPDKRELLVMLKIFGTALQLEKQGDVIKSTLIKNVYTDPMDLLRDYYNLPILTATHPKLKTSIHKLNDEIIKLGISEDLIKINKAYSPYYSSEGASKYFYFDLAEDCKSLTLVKKKPYAPEYKNDIDFPF